MTDDPAKEKKLFQLLTDAADILHQMRAFGKTGKVKKEAKKALEDVLRARSRISRL